eukprot:CAMPEP_0206527654 /NCGR_PEP_ID=MMETSP0325_2-20121206/1476_1 /ASSEMBLY_ACC=CAM_ASM_000347 /TAXON_ID=2866 /ORGANISM="Crypthecodinium cohnii, Strain Seligo" /LENGTH=379 /DNA_ID=CAMNT_0054023103 /DNA_START=460 /DNA_END=1595 /DNA_ORIENTATION=-
MKLGAFLAHSDEMLILYTNVYLQKLWTVYEVAAFLLQQSASAYNMKVVPVSLVGMLLAAVWWSYLQGVTGIFLLISELNLAWSGLIGTLGGACYTAAVRTWQRDKLLMQERLLSFAVRECRCTVDGDRHIIYSNIAALVQALDVFDQIVRDELRPVFKAAFGWCSFEYYHYIFIGFAMTGTLALDYIAILPFSDSPRFHVAGALIWTHWTLIVWPVIFTSLEILMSFKLSYTGWKELLFSVGASLGLVVFPAGVYEWLTLYLMEKAADSNAALALILALGIISITWAIAALYKDACGATRERRRRRQLSGGNVVKKVTGSALPDEEKCSTLQGEGLEDENQTNKVEMTSSWPCHRGQLDCETAVGGSSAPIGEEAEATG